MFNGTIRACVDQFPKIRELRVFEEVPIICKIMLAYLAQAYAMGKPGRGSNKRGMGSLHSPKSAAFTYVVGLAWVCT